MTYLNAQKKRKTRPAVRPDSKSSLRHFSQSLPMLLLRSREAVMRHFRRVLREHQVTEQQWRILRALATVPSMEVSDLARANFLLGPSLSRIVRDLERRRMIQRKIDPNDARRAQICMSKAGFALIEEVSPFSEEIYHQITEAFGDARMRELQQLLEALEYTMNDITLTGKALVRSYAESEAYLENSSKD